MYRSLLIMLMVVLVFKVSIAHFLYDIDAQQIPGYIFDIALSPDATRIAAAGSDGVWLYTPATGSASLLMTETTDGVTWSTDSNRIATVRQPYIGSVIIEIWDAQTLQLLTAIQGGGSTEQHRTIDWSPTSNHVVVGGSRLSIWDADTGMIVRRIELSPTTIMSAKWHPDGTKIASAHDDFAVRIWDASTGGLLNTFDTQEIPRWTAWNSDGSKLALDDGDSIEILDVASGQLLATLQGASKSIWSMAWQDNILAVRDGNTGVIIWDTNTYQRIEFTQPPGRVSAIDLSADGTKLAYSSIDGTLGILPVEIATCIPDQTITAGDIAGLITAINTANANPDADVIGLAAGTYIFTSINNNRNALPRITTDITICSTDGATLTRSPSAPQFRFFEVRSTGKLTLQNLTFTNGSLGVEDDGGAIFNLGTLTVNNVTFSNNQAGVGGAIASEDGQVSVKDSTFTDNASTGDGGAIHSEADLLIESSTFTGNSADDAGAVNNDGGNLTVTDSTFSDNSADDGGAIYNDAGTLTLSGSTFTNNAGDAGGALDNLDGQAQIDTSTFTGNSASDGGAIRNYGGTISLTTSAFTGNTATDDGGALNNSGGTLTITDTRLENNTATTRGGAIYSNSSGTMSAHNSCISGNSATAVYAASTGLQDFTGNWWGAANGPSGAGPGSGDTINSKINHANFLTAGCPLP